MEIMEMTDSHREALRTIRSTINVSRGRIHALDELPGFVMAVSGDIKASVSFWIEGGGCEIVTLDSLEENKGYGTMLIHKVVETAMIQRCGRVWLITTNDNTHAIRYYQKRGFDLKAVHRNAVTEARKLKPSIPLLGNDGIPLKHELEFEYQLGKAL